MIDPERSVAALQFAAEQHHAQRVPGTDHPYIVHVVSVAAETIAALVPAIAIAPTDALLLLASSH